MRVLLTSNASYAPAKGGSTRSNLVWLEHLAGAGHECVVVCSTADSGTDSHLAAVARNLTIHSVRDLARQSSVLGEHISRFRPDWVLVSSEDLTHVLLREAHHSAPGRIVYLAHTPQFYPCGPASWFPDEQATEIVRTAQARVAIAHYTARYLEENCGCGATVIHPPIYGAAPFPRFGSFESGYVLMINPSVVKGIRIFLALAARFPNVAFAGLAGWATTSADRAAMKRLPNVEILESVPKIDEALRNAKLLLMPSIWYEGFGLIVMEAMLRGIPVVSSDAGGLVEAKRDTGYIVPVRPIERFERVFDETHMPKPVEVEQDIEPWERALRPLLTDKTAYDEEAQRSRDAGERFVAQLDAGAFEKLLLSLTPSDSKATDAARMVSGSRDLSPAKKALLLRRLRLRDNR